RPVVGGPLLVPWGDAVPLFELVDAPFQHVAPSIRSGIKSQRALRTGRAALPLVPTPGNRVRKSTPPQDPAARRITEAFVRDDMVGALA
ncbi:MAG: hypothetical protein M3Q71_16950, partial [Chloroflexota bacterium]|nr:hypothetical protein [Chloroflexota bacterium]